MTLFLNDGNNTSMFISGGLEIMARDCNLGTRIESRDYKLQLATKVTKFDVVESMIPEDWKPEFNFHAPEVQS